MPQRYLSHYTLESILGEGGMGTVWKATDTRFGRPVAIKILHPHLARDPGIRQRFYLEAKLMAMLSHPNIVTLLDYIEEGEELGLVMECVEGRSLDRMIGREVGPIVTARALKLFLPLLDAFGYAHAQGIIHRDIKPSNILVTNDDRVKVTDLGIAKILGREGPTLTGTKLGTLVYMSPEQVRGEEATIQSDIYALGMTLYEMVSGQHPFDSTSSSEYEIMDRIVREDLPDPRGFYPDIPDFIIAAIRRATVKEPTGRFRDCQVMSRALRCSRETDDSIGEESTIPLMLSPSMPEIVTAPARRRSSHSSFVHVVQEMLFWMIAGGLFACAAWVVLSSGWFTEAFTRSPDNVFFGPTSDFETVAHTLEAALKERSEHQVQVSNDPMDLTRVFKARRSLASFPNTQLPLGQMFEQEGRMRLSCTATSSDGVQMGVVKFMGHAYNLHEGDTFNGFKVMKITLGQMFMSKDGAQLVLAVEKGPEEELSEPTKETSVSGKNY